MQREGKGNGREMGKLSVRNPQHLQTDKQGCVNYVGTFEEVTNYVKIYPKLPSAIGGSS